MTEPSRTTIMQCPTCKTSIEWSSKNPQRPFCSERCQKIDFGDWASESFAIAGEPAIVDGDFNDEF